MSGTLHLMDPGLCLVDEVSAALAPLDTETLSRTLLVVPTQRLGTALLIRLLEDRPALVPPTLLTFEALLRSAGGSCQPAHDATLDLLLRQLLADHPFRHLRLGHERELRLLYGELYDHGLRTSGMQALQTALIEDIYKNDQHLGSLYDRSVEMAQVFDLLDTKLERMHLCARSDFLARAAQQFAEDWPESSSRYSEVHLIGFTSMAKSWQVALPVLAQDDRVHFWLSEAPKLYHSSSPLKELLKTLGSLPLKVENWQSAQVRPTPRFEAFAAASVLEEVQWASQLVDQAISQGFAPARIAVLVTDEGLYGTAVRSVFSKDRAPCNIALPEIWGGTLAGRHLHALQQFWREKQSLPSLLAWLDHPLTQAATPEAPLAELRRALIESGVPQGLTAMRSELPKTLTEAFDTLCEPLWPFALSSEHSLEVWLQTLLKHLETFAYEASYPSRDLLQSSQDLLEDFAGSLRAFGHEHPKISGLTFWDLLESHLLCGSIRSTGEPMAGIQILSLAEARYFPFDWVILLGCHEGCFPKALPQDELLDNYLKRAMGLPGWEVLEAMEDQTFHLLRARLPHLCLLRPARLGEEAQVRSRFTEALLAREGRHEKTLPSPWALRDEEAGLLGEEGQLANWLAPSTGRISASRLERLITCPYAFLLDSLGVRSEAGKADETDGRREGEWLHAVLQAFMSGEGPKGRYLEPWVHSAEPRKAEALERLNTLTLQMAPYDLRETALLHHLQETAWPLYVDHLLVSIGAYQSVREFAFGTSRTPVTAHVKGRTRELHGRIDALDFSAHWSVITDYKRKTIPPLEKTRRGENAQLAFYAAALQQCSPVRPLPPLVLGYWNIYQGSWTAHAISEEHRSELIAQGLSAKATPNLSELQEGLIATWEWRETEIETKGRFYADPSACGLCDYAGLCRKDDPRVHERIGQQNELERRSVDAK